MSGEKLRRINQREMFCITFLSINTYGGYTEVFLIYIKIHEKLIQLKDKAPRFNRVFNLTV